VRGAVPCARVLPSGARERGDWCRYLARERSNLVEVLLLHLPRRSSLYYRSEVECTTPFHHVLLPLVGAHRVAATDLPHTFSDGRKLLARKTCQLARDVQEYAPV